MTVYKTFTVESKAIDEEQGIYEAFVSTEDVDRDGDVILAEGVDLSNYLRNPVVPFGHNYYSPDALVARTLEAVKIPGKGVKLLFQFVTRGVSRTADLVHDLWAGKFLNAMSIGFIPKEWERRKDANGEDLARGWLFKAVEMLEGSIVTVPANQSALRAALEGKEFNPDEYTALMASLEKQANDFAAATGEDEAESTIQDEPVLDEQETGEIEPEKDADAEPNIDATPIHDAREAEADYAGEVLLEFATLLEGAFRNDYTN